ncbi:unnamed protein product [Bursaphelenchus xylophilus]|uniref:(pine wood nematode) hypothetical protein n=1 Tax=Bursaphelenchus xylophilus TaxID=6326 RepID=A0A1I7RXE1_BURXY|nr:unnamed protein product [Bursaphelenchus xylophilus]CAG9126317.1 unnamed protein product [Bursaphelenchus xylophilus]
MKFLCYGLYFCTYISVIIAELSRSIDLLHASRICCPLAALKCCREAILSYDPIRCLPDIKENQRIVECHRRIVSERPLTQSLACCDSVYKTGSVCHQTCVELEMTPALRLVEKLHQMQYCKIGASNKCITKCQHVLPKAGKFDTSWYLRACGTYVLSEEVPFEEERVVYTNLKSPFKLFINSYRPKFLYVRP